MNKVLLITLLACLTGTFTVCGSKKPELEKDNYADYGFIRGVRGMWGSSYDTQTVRQLMLTDLVNDKTLQSIGIFHGNRTLITSQQY